MHVRAPSKPLINALTAFEKSEHDSPDAVRQISFASVCLAISRRGEPSEQPDSLVYSTECYIFRD